MRKYVFLALFSLTSCAGGDDEAAQDEARCYVGDPAAAPEVELIYRNIDGTMGTLDESGRVPMILPPQGGKVFLVGVRARNIDICGVRLHAALRDQCSGRIVGAERRPIFLGADGTGWAVPRQPHELSDYANVPACPSFGTDRDVDG